MHARSIVFVACELPRFVKILKIGRFQNDLSADLLTSKQASKEISTCLLAKISVENLLACLLASRAGNLLVTCLLACLIWYDFYYVVHIAIGRLWKADPTGLAAEPESETCLTRTWIACNWRVWKMLPDIFDDEIDDIRNVTEQGWQCWLMLGSWGSTCI